MPNLLTKGAGGRAGGASRGGPGGAAAPPGRPKSSTCSTFPGVGELRKAPESSRELQGALGELRRAWVRKIGSVAQAPLS
eukprot:15448515-Alexandrium_andersonii.AAC.1